MKSLTWCVIVCATLAACTAYRSAPLDFSNSAPLAAIQIVVDPQSMSLPSLRNHRFDPRDGLDMEEVAMIAVANNPDLKLARADRRIDLAQAFSAGLLPDPQLSLTRDFPKSGNGLESAFNVGLSFDFGALASRPALRGAADATLEKTDLSVLWQEWQVVSQARQLFVKIRTSDALEVVLKKSLEIQDARYQAGERAMRVGNLGADAVGPYLIAREDVRKQLADLQRQRNISRHALNALLGLDPQAQLDLIGEAQIAPLDEDAIRMSLEMLARHRPDLIALEAGYRAQDEKYRAAILGQFPAITIGMTRARDTSGIYTSGFGVNISLPIFNRNQGNVRIEAATRDKLREEYAIRLLQARSDIDQMRIDQAQMEAQLRQINAALPELVRTVERAQLALGRGQITIASYADLEAALTSKKVDAINLEDAILEQRVALQTILGGDLPVQYRTDRK